MKKNGTEEVKIYIQVNEEFDYMNLEDFTITCKKQPKLKTAMDYFLCFAKDYVDLYHKLEEKWEEALNQLPDNFWEGKEELEEEYECSQNDFETIPLPEHEDLIQKFCQKYHPSFKLTYGWDEDDMDIHGLGSLDKVTDFHHAFGDSTDFWRDLAETVTFQNESIGVR